MNHRHSSTSHFRIAWLVALQIIFLITATAARTCPPGSFDNGFRCKKCRRGTYQNEQGSTSCKKCPAGTFTKVTGVPSEFLCRECPEDSTSRPGSDKCFKCPSGQIRRCGECKRCPPGSSFRSGCSCEKCSPDSFSKKANQLECTECPPGLRSSPDRKRCIDAGCPAGTQWDFNECVICEFRSFRNSSFSTCQPCPPRTTVPNFFEPHEKCERCPPGMFLTDLFVFTDEQVPVCEKCPPGSSTKGFSKAFCRRDGKPCPEGTFEDDEGDCDVCEEGYRYNPKQNKCVKCGPDEVSDGGLQTTCEKCLPGQISVDGLFCECPEGQELVRGRCRLCPAGTGNCVECFINEFSPVPGSTEPCTPCPAGSLSIESGGKRCKPVRCKKGFFQAPLFVSSFPENVCISVRTGCPKGLFFITDIGTRIICGDKKGNVVCPKGEVFNKEDLCISCSTGFKLVETKEGTLSCDLCPESKPVSRGGITRKCRRCTKGFEPSDDNSKCVCPFGKFVTKNGKCRECPKKGQGGQKRRPKGCPRL